jgi:hypothetical protein
MMKCARFGLLHDEGGVLVRLLLDEGCAYGIIVDERGACGI